MRAADAPAAGWYPDPQSRTRLRWWDGLDWTEARRAPPSDSELERYELPVPTVQGQAIDQLRATAGAANRLDTQQIITEVRNVARAEVDRAAEEFTHRAQAAVQSVTPIIDQYSGRVLRIIRFAAISILLLLIAWFTFQTLAQASMLEWIGDRIDNLFDDENSAVGQLSTIAYTSISTT